MMGVPFCCPDTLCCVRSAPTHIVDVFEVPSSGGVCPSACIVTLYAA